MKRQQMLLSSLILVMAIGFSAPVLGASLERQLVVAAAKSSPAIQEAKRALDQGDYERARRIFAEVAAEDPTQAEMALFWKAYAEQRARRRTEALQTIKQLQRKYPNGRWADDAEALRVEIEQRRGHSRRGRDELPEDAELKMYALMGLANIDEEAALEALREILESDESDAIKSRALFLLTQIDEEAARSVLPGWAANAQSRQLRHQAIQMLGMIGDEASLDALDELYSTSTNAGEKHMILQAYVHAEDSDRLRSIVRAENNDSLKAQAIRMLGMLEDTEGLHGLIEESDSEQVRRAVLQAAMMAEDSELLLDVFNSSGEPRMRAEAIQMLGMMEYEDSEFFLTVYREAKSEAEQGAALRALMFAEDGEALVQIFRTETDLRRKRQILQILSMTDDESAQELFEEILRQ